LQQKQYDPQLFRFGALLRLLAIQVDVIVADEVFQEGDSLTLKARGVNSGVVNYITATARNTCIELICVPSRLVTHGPTCGKMVVEPKGTFRIVPA
jgi:hypothetical protein